MGNPGRSITLSSESRIEAVGPLASAARRIARLGGLGELDCYNVELCVTEALTNIIRHAYGERPGQPLTLEVRLEPEQLTLIATDCGVPIDDENKEPADISFDPDDLESVKESGRGLFLIHNLMDGVEFQHREACNLLIMVKALPPLALAEAEIGDDRG